MKQTAVGVGVLVAFLLLAVAAVGGVGATTTQADNASSNASFGAEVSSFMQASSAEAEGEIDDGMFNAALDRTEDPEERRAIIEQRQQRLQQRQQRLEERRANISEENPGVRDYALATHVEVGADSLERSANGTEHAAEAAGLDVSQLTEIRTNARNLKGPDVSELAHDLTKRSNNERGPPADQPGSEGDDQPGQAPDEEGDGSSGADNRGNASDTGNGQSEEPGPPGTDDPAGDEESDADPSEPDDADASEPDGSGYQ